MLLQACAKGLYCCETVSISAITLSVSSTFLLISAASCLSLSNVVITESLSNILPLASFNACNNDFSNCLKLTVKLTNITLEHMSGENSTVGSRVDKNMTNFGDKSISWSPSVIKTRPPVRRSSRNGFPKRNADSRFFLKESSKKLVFVILASAYSFRINSVACPEGSIINGEVFHLDLTNIQSTLYQIYTEYQLNINADTR
ncbi:hypothetical protein AGLY_013658 [Aphis glycines]|uniref:Uncharacterized protein n=1 Tax=Aphis glycines TaxID=307491 RepID=A0A6G0T7A3_APHGL|nr:hypothetical protein AGLY_013658 [Aphis glycines]